ncbi:alkyl sulfatase [Corynebacterium sp. CNJ-954]|jgi:alkyl sulfatase BDS1-like metallo-beta-lactamase superfamily hydrolase|uniref:alkyl/aryl-sulfatase n=1 Tax=Corynebacterium sp. CNJ-954 TaxID=1904962 RepID=UPI00095D89CD|nr:alkyl sulfatase dimerization domain-containing protein [Corynebacterium sp. CNJ-954]OLT50326.1 alkyl sulfatase [Corynebacterium sp. CNJ-954]
MSNDDPTSGGPVAPGQTEPTHHVTRANAAVHDALPFDDTKDFEDADRGFLRGLTPGVIKNAKGRTVWDVDAYRFLDGECPPSVNPSLWRQSQLNNRQGLYEVVPGIYQIRGLDLSVMTIVEGDTGVVIVDPLTSTEAAEAGLALYSAERGGKPVTGVIYSHSHVDHFGGVLGVTTREDVEAGRCPVYGPAGFTEEAIAENVYAGTAMTRRSTYMYGALLGTGPFAGVGTGLGQAVSRGRTGLIPPTRYISETAHVEEIDGVEIIFQLTPGTEAPAEMNMYFPAHRALCVAENASHNMHNIVTLRGALVRDARQWAGYLTETINKYARRADVCFGSHHWPTWGNENLVEYLTVQRDMYGYLHDQTLRLLNQGYVGSEIAEQITMPPTLEKTWSTRGYYGSVSHNVKAIYQRYMGWFDGNPAHLWEHPPVEGAKRHVDAMGGADAALAVAQKAYDDGDFRWAAQVANYVIFADEDNEAAKLLQACTFEQLAYGSENATWRNFYLTGAQELRRGPYTPSRASSAPALATALTVPQLLDSLALRIDGEKAWDISLVSDWQFTDGSGDVHRVELSNGVLTHFPTAGLDDLPPAQATLTLDKNALLQLLNGTSPAALTASGDVKVEGDSDALTVLPEVTDQPDPGFSIVTP